MPAVGVGAVIASAVGLVGTQATIAAVVINTSLTLVATGVYNALNANKDDAKSRFDPPVSSGFSDGTEVAVRAVISPQRLILGEASLAGVYSLTNTSKEGVVYEGDQAEQNDLPGGNYLVHQYLLAGHEIDSIQGLRIGETDLFVDSMGNAIGGDFSKDEVNIRVSYQYGLLNQYTDPLIRENFPEIDRSNFAHRQHATATVEYYYGESDEKHNEIYSTNTDPVFRVKGMKVYDPRDKDQEYYDVTTHKWTDNAALLLAGVLTNRKFGRRVRYTDFNMDLLARAAEICEEGITILEDGVEKVIPQYTINGVINTSERQLDVLTDMLTSCFGRMVQTQGGISIIAGKHQESQGVITEDDLEMPGFEYRAGLPEEAIVNKIRGRFISPQENYFRQDAPILESFELETLDGIENPKTINYRFTEGAGRVQRLMKLGLEHNRLQRGLKLYIGRKGIIYDISKPITVDLKTFPYVNGLYNIDEINMSGDASRFEFLLSETSAEQYNWNHSTDQRDYVVEAIFNG